MLTHSSGDVVVSGWFTAIGSNQLPGIARYRPSTGEWFPLGDLAGGWGVPIVELPGGDLLAARGVPDGFGNTLGVCARLSWATGHWEPIFGGPLEQAVDLVALGNGRTLARGRAIPAFGGSYNELAFYDAVTGWWTDGGNWIGQRVLAEARLPNGDWLVGGIFDSTHGAPGTNIARLSVQTGEYVSVGSGTDGPVYRTTTLPNGNVFIYGAFRTLNGQPAPGIGMYDPTAGAWAPLGEWNGEELAPISLLADGRVLLAEAAFWNPGPEPATFYLIQKWLVIYDPTTNTFSRISKAFLNFVWGAALAGPNRVMVAGDWRSQSGLDFDELGLLSLNNGEWSSAGASGIAAPQSLLALPGGDVLAFGTFRGVAGLNGDGLARYNARSNSWSATGWTADDRATPAALFPNGDALVFGRFSTIGGITSAGLARWSPTSGQWTDVSFPNVGSFDVATIGPEGEIYAGGYGLNAPTSYDRTVFRRDPVNGQWSLIGVYPAERNRYERIRTMKVLPGGDLVAAGDFAELNGLAAQAVARYSPTTGLWSNMGTWPGRGIQSLSITVDGVLLAVDYYDGTVRRWEPASESWPDAFPTTNRRIGKVLPTRAGDVILVGYVNDPTLPFTISAWRARLGSADWSLLGTFGLGGVTDAAWTDRSTLLVAGTFSLRDDQFSSDFAVYRAACPCSRADIASVGGWTLPDGRVGVDDLLLFLGLFFVQDPRADLASVGGGLMPDGQCTADDIISFLSAYFAGCP